MSKLVLTGVVSGLLGVIAALAADGPQVPDFSSNNVAWDGNGDNDFTAPKNGPGPVTFDPALAPAYCQFHKGETP